MRVYHTATPQRVLIANSKGGCGKTTIATNLASYYATRNHGTALVDYDPQGSSALWLKARNGHEHEIHGISAYKQQSNLTTQSWQLRVPQDTTRVILDTPAGIPQQQLSTLIRQSDVIIVPVLPSPIDIRAATHFIGNILLNPEYRRNPKHIAVIANRVKRNTLIYGKLELFLKSLKIPFIGSLRDTQNYVKASDQGLGVHDWTTPTKKDRREWFPIIYWIEKHLSHNKSEKAH